jgi:hypothetical protein
MDDELFGTKKYSNGTSQYLTVFTYSEEHNGAIALYKAVLQDNVNAAVRLELVASMTEVPRNILRQLRRQVQSNRIDIRFKGSKIRFRRNGQRSLPWPSMVHTGEAGRSYKEWCRSG